MQLLDFDLQGFALGRRQVGVEDGGLIGEAVPIISHDAAVTEAVHQDVCTAFAEDRTIIEAQQRILRTAPDFRPVASTHDQALTMARHLLRQRLQAEAAQ